MYILSFENVNFRYSLDMCLVKIKYHKGSVLSDKLWPKFCFMAHGFGN